jgi:hypothetical protein
MQEVATYHRKDGLLIKEHDDAISASRYALMMRPILAERVTYDRNLARYSNPGTARWRSRSGRRRLVSLRGGHRDVG